MSYTTNFCMTRLSYQMPWAILVDYPKLTGVTVSPFLLSLVGGYGAYGYEFLIGTGGITVTPPNTWLLPWLPPRLVG